MIDNPQVHRESCYLCNNRHSEILERHHIVPKRYGGSDDRDNLVDVCPNCRRKLRLLYDDSFFERLGVKRETTDDDVDEDTTNEEPSDPVLRLVEALEPEYTPGVPAEEVLERAPDIGLEPTEAEQQLEQLKQKGEVYEPTHDHLRST